MVVGKSEFESELANSQVTSLQKSESLFPMTSWLKLDSKMQLHDQNYLRIELDVRTELGIIHQSLVGWKLQERLGVPFQKFTGSGKI